MLSSSIRTSHLSKYERSYEPSRVYRKAKLTFYCVLSNQLRPIGISNRNWKINSVCNRDRQLSLRLINRTSACHPITLGGHIQEKGLLTEQVFTVKLEL